MALLDQLFRLRGAPRSADRPVTLGAVVAALPDAKPAEAVAQPETSEAVPEAVVKTETDASPPSAPGERSEPDPVLEVPAQPAIRDEPLRQAPQTSARGGMRFNPFATAADTTTGGEDAQSRAARSAAGPCLDDPGLPPLKLQAHVVDNPADRPVILGIPAAADEGAPAIVLRQIDAPTIRPAPVKSPSRASEQPPVANAGPLKLRLEIEAEASVDVVAFKQYAAKFPGVLKCVISNARA